jgi:integrase
LRHTKATEVEAKFGIEVTQLLLGHTSPETTKCYLDPNAKLKKQIKAAKENHRKTTIHSTK